MSGGGSKKNLLPADEQSPSAARRMSKPAPIMRGRSGAVQLSDPTEQLRLLFNEFDDDNSGSISTNEIEAIAGRLGIQLTKEEIEALLLEVDGDNSGEIEFAEFVELVNRAKVGGMNDIISSLKSSYLDDAALAAGAADCEWYTEEMIIARERLKTDSKVTAALLGAWDTCSGGTGRVDKAGYLQMIRLIYLQLKAQ
eukprot:7387465-Prymnesium_polylepis.1